MPSQIIWNQTIKNSKNQRMLCYRLLL